MPATDPQTLISASNCFECYLPQFPLMELALLRQILLALNPNAMTDPQSLISQGSCFNCFLPQYPLMVLALLSQIAASSGGGGGGVTCGAAIPVAPPTGSCGFYIRQQGVNTALYAWDGAAWQAIVGT